MQEHFTDAQIADFLRRSYFVLDGLWFVKTEESRGFDEAIALDEAVWEIMSKIQARKAKSLLGILGNSLADFARAFQLKLAAEGHDYKAELTDQQFVLAIRVCPWYEILKTSGRTHIADIIADRICSREFAGWTREFDPRIETKFELRLCIDNSEACTVKFRIKHS
jgi:hypothetical protein